MTTWSNNFSSIGLHKKNGFVEMKETDYPLTFLLNLAGLYIVAYIKKL